MLSGAVNVTGQRVTGGTVARLSILRVKTTLSGAKPNGSAMERLRTSQPGFAVTPMGTTMSPAGSVQDLASGQQTFVAGRYGRPNRQLAATRTFAESVRCGHLVEVSCAGTAVVSS